MFDSPAAAGTAADAVLLVHAVFVAFVVFGQVFVLAGWALGWRSARNRWFRRLHLIAIGLVVIQAWLGATCPLTSVEAELREAAGAGTYDQGFIAHWASAFLYYEFPPWVFVLAYSLFGGLVLASYWGFPPLAASSKHRPAD